MDSIFEVVPCSMTFFRLNFFPFVEDVMILISSSSADGPDSWWLEDRGSLAMLGRPSDRSRSRNSFRNLKNRPPSAFLLKLSLPELLGSILVDGTG